MSHPMMRRFRLFLPAVVLLAGVSAGRVVAQDAGANATPAMLRTEYLNNMKDVEEKVVGLAEAFPEAKYAWRPMAGVRSVSEVLMHIASEHYVYMPMTVGAKPPADLNMGARGDRRAGEGDGQGRRDSPPEGVVRVPADGADVG
jgi:hypothetical protein